jgi:hypothetical protein
MKSTSINYMRIPRIVARIMSAIIVGFALLMFIGESMESNNKVNPDPMSIYTIVQLALFGIGLLCLALAWKWELIGGIISLLAFIAIIIVNPEALVLPMFIFPANAVLFIGIGYQSEISINRLEKNVT